MHIQYYVLILKQCCVFLYDLQVDRAFLCTPSWAKGILASEKRPCACNPSFVPVCLLYVPCFSGSSLSGVVLLSQVILVLYKDIWTGRYRTPTSDIKLHCPVLWMCVSLPEGKHELVLCVVSGHQQVFLLINGSLLSWVFLR